MPQPTRPWWFIPLLIAAAAGFGLLIYNLFKTGRKGWAWALIIALVTLLFFLLRNAGSGGEFGGGSSGGGGASGSW